MALRQCSPEGLREQSAQIANGVTIYNPTRRFGIKHGWSCPCGGIQKLAELVVVINKNGARQYRLRCDSCLGGNLRNIPLKDITEYERDHALIIKDNRDARPCVRCGDTGNGENHHTAPSAAFGLDAETWPIIRLCLRCHSLWHATMDAYYRGRFEE